MTRLILALFVCATMNLSAIESRLAYSSTGFLHRLSQLDEKQLESMQDASQKLEKCYSELAEKGVTLFDEALGGAQIIPKWEHFPTQDVFDSDSKSLYFFHRHRAMEAGHFHCYLKGERYHHLVAISIDEHGLPIKLFTPNHWLVNEGDLVEWISSERTILDLQNFAVKDSSIVSRWVSAMVKLFEPQIMDLLHQRDQVLADWKVQHPESDPLNDRELELPAFTLVSLEGQSAATAQVLYERTPEETSGVL